MKILSKEQYTPEWWDARRGLPTASCFSKIITPARGEYSKQADDYACQLVSELYDPTYGQDDDGFKTSAMKNGTILEPEARAFYQLHRNADVDEVGLCTTDDGRFGSSPDGLVGDDGCVEIKSVIAKTQIAYIAKGVLPNEYKPQCHGHLFVTGRKWCDFFSYSPGLPPFLIRITPDGFTKKLEVALNHFHDELNALCLQVSAIQPPPSHEVEEPGDIVLF